MHLCVSLRSVGAAITTILSFRFSPNLQMAITSADRIPNTDQIQFHKNPTWWANELLGHMGMLTEPCVMVTYRMWVTPKWLYHHKVPHHHGWCPHQGHIMESPFQLTPCIFQHFPRLLVVWWRVGRRTIAIDSATSALFCHLKATVMVTYLKILYPEGETILQQIDKWLNWNLHACLSRSAGGTFSLCPGIS